MSDLYHGEQPVDMTPGEAADEIARISRKMSIVERDREVRQACEVVRAAARRLTVLGWGNSAGDLMRALETIESALAGDRSAFQLTQRLDRYRNDDAAKALYDTWSDRPGWVPWVDCGNSLMQERARREVTL